ncbi:AEC family transporter [Aquabacterium sp. A7-Y]|uniref:AEC family transporter n=1 Tax=Aquabacterium sp. A7-Y TaxID=1349605 RepID=UPI00223D7E82|nr:AEC family transporter [Aquabacterium sp. A7-Y]MCW7536678.1 AEC family transporter [Aquabacterium sp. A7-Y]
MSSVVSFKLLAIFAVVALGWGAGRMKFFGGGETARALSNAAFFLFAPALLFRTTARIDIATLPWSTLAAFFVPATAWMVAIYFSQRRRALASPAGPSVRALTATFGNTAQLGIPMAAALFGEQGLSMHLAIVSVHALTLLSVQTVLVELDVGGAAAREQGGRASLRRMLLQTVRNTLIHPVVLPVLAGLAWNLTGWRIAEPVDGVLLMLGEAVVPVCLVGIGMSLAHYGLKGAAGSASALTAAKVLAMPLLVLLAGYFVAGLRGLPLTVIVMAAALPTGSNALMFAQRYRSQEAETTAAIVVSTLSFVLAAPLWLSLLAVLPQA